MKPPALHEWNHNIHYYDFVLRSVPPKCGLALDVGCGPGVLARQLALRCDSAIGIDSDRSCLAAARAAGGSATYMEADAIRPPFRKNSFDFISVVATLHHLPLSTALERFRDLLRPGGVLAIVGLYRAETLADYALSAFALPASLLLRLRHGYSDVGAPLSEPRETLREVREACARILPGTVVRRRLLFRYSAVWRKAQVRDRIAPDTESSDFAAFGIGRKID